VATSKKKPAAKKAPAKKKAAPKQPAKLGRPSSFTQEVADAICLKLAEGLSLRTICLAEDMPSATSVFRWLADDSRTDFREQYARAREAQAERLAEEILTIADDGTADWTVGERGQEVLNAEAVARSRLRVDARKWLASKLAPKKYGEKIAVGGADDLPPVRSVHEMSTDALLAIASQAAK
jgi:hypothetical protein